LGGRIEREQVDADGSPAGEFADRQFERGAGGLAATRLFELATAAC
jgi:hypothetical protein